ncbi:MAG: hypothetical protein ABEJ28_09345 [Salinigranum sp.]
MNVPDTATATLLVVPSISPADKTVCTDLLVRGTEEPPNVLHVDFVRTPRERVRDWQLSDSHPADLAILHVDTYTRGADAGAEAGADTYSELSPVVETIQNPSDLTGLGVALTKCLERWEDDERPGRVCFHSISALLHYVDLSAAFQFLNVVRGQLARADVTGHFHVQPGAHGDKTLNKLYPLFDAIVEVDVDGDVEVTAR